MPVSQEHKVTLAVMDKRGRELLTNALWTLCNSEAAGSPSLQLLNGFPYFQTIDYYASNIDPNNTEVDWANWLSVQTLCLKIIDVINTLRRVPFEYRTALLGLRKTPLFTPHEGENLYLLTFHYSWLFDAAWEAIKLDGKPEERFRTQRFLHRIALAAVNLSMDLIVVLVASGFEKKLVAKLFDTKHAILEEWGVDPHVEFMGSTFLVSPV